MSSFLASIANAVLPRPIASLISSYYSTPQIEPFSDPTPAQVDEVREILMTTPKRGLPAELADIIIEFAEYWPITLTTVDLELEVVAGWSPTPMTFLYLKTPPLGIPMHGELVGKPRKVVFNTLSRDQGWADNQRLHGTYYGSYSWFEASIFRRSDTSSELSTLETLLESAGPPANDFEALEDGQTRFNGEQCDIADLEPRLQERGWSLVRDEATRRNEGESERVSWVVQRNVVAGQALKEHVVEWREEDDDDLVVVEQEFPVNGAGTGEGFMKSLRRGDVIGVWARALYVGWRNEVAEVGVKVYYSL